MQEQDPTASEHVPLLQKRSRSHILLTMSNDNTKPLSIEVRRAILRYLRDRPATSDELFDQWCNLDTALFGRRSTAKRTKVQQWKYDICRRYLDSSKRETQTQERFDNLLKRHGLDPTPVTVDPDSDTIPGNEEDFDFDSAIPARPTSNRTEFEIPRAATATTSMPSSTNFPEESESFSSFGKAEEKCK